MRLDEGRRFQASRGLVHLRRGSGIQFQCELPEHWAEGPGGGFGRLLLPNWSEIAVTFRIMAAGFASLRVAADYFSVVEQRSHGGALALQEMEADLAAVK